MVNLTAVTTVVLIKGDSDESEACNFGRRLFGSINVNLPKNRNKLSEL